MAYVNPLNPATPANGDQVSAGAGEIRTVKAALIERLETFFADIDVDPLSIKTGPVYAGTQNFTSITLASASFASVVGQGKFIGGSTGYRFRNNADAADIVTISDAGAVVIASALTVTAGGLTVSAGGAAISGNSSITGTLGVSSDFAVNTNKFTVAAASGNTVVAGTLGVTGAATFSSTLAVTSDFSINTNKFTVTAASGNTVVAGTLAVASDFAIATNKFTVAAASGNTVVAGNLDVTGTMKSVGALGYATGAGGTQSQGAGRNTGLTINKICGQISCSSDANLVAPNVAEFTVTNSQVGASDVVVVSLANNTFASSGFVYNVRNVTAGAFNIAYYNTQGVTIGIGAAPIFNFAVIKSVTS